VQTGTPKAEVAIDAGVVRRLLAAQHPDLAGLALTELDAGWDNAMYRLGEALMVRLPRRAVAAELMRHEQDWLPVLAPRLPLAVPAPVRLGRPAEGYPWSWSVVPWVAGETADAAPPEAAEALNFARFLRALHRPTPERAPRNPFRDVPLGARREAVEGRLQRLAPRGLVAPGVEAVFARALAAPEAGAKHWIHGDLHARNVIVADGRIAAVVDWGDLCAGDVATDLAGFWLLFEDGEARRAGLECYGATVDQVARAMGWAVLMGAIHLETGLEDHPQHARIGAAALGRVAADAG
jgi:aminoglycoside phosphotransferase (APT) family kinase protein